MDDLSDFDFSSFWRDSDYAREKYVEPAPNTEALAAVERQIGVRLPKAYITLANFQNGGIPINTAYPSKPTSWAEDHIALHAVFSIGFAEHGLCGEMGSEFWKEEWGYPDDLIYFADCPSGGHDMIALDYRRCGPEGEPAIVHVDQEGDYEITTVASSFGEFIRGLKPEDEFA